MIASLNGRITSLDKDSVVLEVGGVGLRVYVPSRLLGEVQAGHSLMLYTHLVVRENELSLYGFQTREGSEVFELLLGVNGVGPRLALAILGTLQPDSIRQAVANGQAEVFSRVSGVGKKTAQKILLHLQDRVEAFEGLGPVALMAEGDAEVLEALTALGYSVVEAQAAIQSIPKDAPDEVEERLRLALTYFSSPR